MDRIDLYHDVAPVTAMDLTLPAPSEGTAEAAARVTAAREIQADRFADAVDMAGASPRRAVNADAGTQELDTLAKPNAAGAALLADAAAKLALTARAYHRTLKVARTIADLDGGGGVARIHIAEALSYRRRMPGQDAASVHNERLAQ